MTPTATFRQRAPRIAAALACLVAWAAAPAAARVERIEILERGPFAGGMAFGAAGPYERLRGRLHYAVDPDDPANAVIVDLDRAPRDARGLVVFAGDFLLLRPVDPAGRPPRLLYEVNNRGGLGALALFNDAPHGNDPATAADAGNGFLMRQGYALLWTGWNWDVLPGEGRMQIELPVARAADGAPLTGPVAAEMVTDRPAECLPAVWGWSRGYPAAEPAGAPPRLTVRPTQQAEREAVPDVEWRFLGAVTDPTEPAPPFVCLADGFAPGLIYELVYEARDPRVVGLGLAAIRDALSFFRFAAADEAGTANPLAASAGPPGTVAFGISQSGRVLQHMLWQGLHVDEAGRPVFDAALIHVAGGGKGSFNHRFAQTTRHPSPHEDHGYPVDVFPFTTTAEREPLTGQEASVLDRARQTGAVPFLFYTGTSTEYWTRAASLLHTDPAGEADAAIARQARVYVVAGAQHGSFVSPFRGPFAHCLNPLDHRPVMRALLLALDRWASEGVPPPDSVLPRLADGTLGSLQAWRAAFPAIPGALLPTGNLQPPRLDLGPRFAEEGIVDLAPARLGPPYVTRVPLPDADGNDLGGIRLPAVAVPLGTYTGWNVKPGADGAPDRLGRWEGSFFPFAATEAERRSAGDPRPSLAARYGSADDYADRVAEAAAELVAQGFLLEEDVPAITATAARAHAALADGAAANCADLAAFE